LFAESLIESIDFNPKPVNTLIMTYDEEFSSDSIIFVYSPRTKVERGTVVLMTPSWPRFTLI
jgi:hypothetical protein